ncbi:MAG: hypothetical protein JSR67_17190 [Proteobacteria bacterium]|nr:hypothetical protein [Pseudomonadota bacterium]
MRSLKELLAGRGGGSSAGPLVVRRHAPLLRRLLWGAGALVALFACYVIYELGRYDAGYDRQAAAQQRVELRVQIEHLQNDNRGLRTRLAELETIRVGRANEQAEVAREMGDLQAQVNRQSHELAFLRGVVAQGAATLGVRIEQLRITAGARPGYFTVHLALVRTGRTDSEATGTILLSVDGETRGIPRTLDLVGLTFGHQREIRYGFRYLQHLDQEISLPAGFNPLRVAVEVRSARRDLPALSQSFLWSVEAGP